MSKLELPQIIVDNFTRRLSRYAIEEANRQDREKMTHDVSRIVNMYLAMLNTLDNPILTIQAAHGNVIYPALRFSQVNSQNESGLVTATGKGLAEDTLKVSPTSSEGVQQLVSTLVELISNNTFDAIVITDQD